MQEELEMFPVSVLQNNDDECADILIFSPDSNVLATISELSCGKYIYRLFYYIIFS